MYDMGIKVCFRLSLRHSVMLEAMNGMSASIALALSYFHREHFIPTNSASSVVS